jgi:DNA-binding CsgD family transcriptional regulator
MGIDARGWKQIAQLYGSLMEHPVADVHGATSHMLEGLTRLVGASDAFWLISRRRVSVRGDPLRGWRPHVTESTPRPSGEVALRSAWYAHVPNVLTDPQTIGMARGAGRHRAHLRRELVDDRCWERCPQTVEILRPLRILDRVVTGFPLSPTVEVFVGLDRRDRDRPFEEHHRDLLRASVEGLGWLHRRLAWSYGLPTVTEPLAPRERAVLLRLLGGRSEKDVAAELRITAASTHQYVVSLYRKLGVSTRAELLARWPDGGGDRRSSAPSQRTGSRPDGPTDP